MKRIIVATLCLCAVSAPATAQQWKYNAVLYGWLAGLKGTVGVADLAEKPIDASFKDLANYLDFAMAGHFEASNPNLVFLTDVDYTKLGASRDGEVLGQTVSVDMDFTQWILELTGGYRVTEEFDLLLSGRYYIFELGTTTTSIAGQSPTDRNQNWGDIYLGARYTKLFHQKWLFSVRGDLGAGGSQFAWFANIDAAYRFTKLVSAGVAWRVLSLDHEGDKDANYFTYDVTQSGLGVGLGFSF